MFQNDDMENTVNSMIDNIYSNKDENFFWNYTIISRKIIYKYKI